MTSSINRHLISFILFAPLLASCNSHDPQEHSGSASMRFGVDPMTRTHLTENESITSAPFAVFGDMVNFDGKYSPNTVKLHEATVVSYDPAENQWLYDNTQYWIPGYRYSFVAIHPANSTNLSDYLYENNKLSFSYNQPAQYKEASDLLVSAHRREYDGGDTDLVRFGFSHILTNVNVQMSYKGASSGPSSLSIEEMTFKNIPLKSTYSITPAPLTAGSKMTSDWVNDEGSQYGWTVKERGDLEIVFPEGERRIISANGGSFQLFTGNDALLLLPNPDDPDSRAELELTYTTDTGVRETISAVIPAGWNPGNNLNLKWDIGNSSVQFSISVEEWKNGDSTDTTVPRK